MYIKLCFLLLVFSYTVRRRERLILINKILKGLRRFFSVVRIVIHRLQTRTDHLTVDPIPEHGDRGVHPGIFVTAPDAPGDDSGLIELSRFFGYGTHQRTAAVALEHVQHVFRYWLGNGFCFEDRQTGRRAARIYKRFRRHSFTILRAFINSKILDCVVIGNGKPSQE